MGYGSVDWREGFDAGRDDGRSEGTHAAAKDLFDLLLDLLGKTTDQPIGPIVRRWLDEFLPQDPSPRREGIPGWLRKQVYERDGYRCVVVGCGTWIDLSCDHIIPVAAGGPTTLENLQTMCRPHNSQKGCRQA